MHGMTKLGVSRNSTVCSLTGADGDGVSRETYQCSAVSMMRQNKALKSINTAQKKTALRAENTMYIKYINEII